MTTSRARRVQLGRTSTSSSSSDQAVRRLAGHRLPQDHVRRMDPLPKLMQDAGANALELNVYYLATNPSEPLRRW